MKTLSIILKLKKMKFTRILLLTSLLFWLESCSAVLECEQVNKRHLAILIDASDPRLLEESISDLESGLGPYLERHSYLNQESCFSSKMSIGYLASDVRLETTSATIGIDRKGVSKKAERQATSPRPFINLFREMVKKLKELIQDPEFTAGTNIVNNLAKTILSSDDDLTVLLFTDGIENNAHLNFYRNIPNPSEVQDLIPELFEPQVYERLKNHLARNQNQKVIFYLQSDPLNSVDRRAVKAFWVAFFQELQIPFEFKDRISNT